MTRVILWVLIAVFALTTAAFYVDPALAQSRSVSGPRVAHPLQPVAPWDDVTVVTNITDRYLGTRNVTLLYSIDSSLPRHYVSVPMKLVRGDEWEGDYLAQIPRQLNGTTVYYFTKIVDGNGGSYVGSYDEQEPNWYRVIVFDPSFDINELFAENINSKDLTVDLLASFRIYYAVQPEPDYITVQAQNEYWDLQPIRVSYSQSDRFTYDGQVHVKGFHMLGDASAYPFDQYYLDINFSLPFQTRTANFRPERIYLFEPSNHYVWGYSTSNRTDAQAQSGARINFHMNISRRVENAYPVVLPLIIAFLVLGGSVMLDSGEQLETRAALYLTLFVFVIGFVATIGASIPGRASGVTVAETASYSLATYVGGFIIASIFANFSMRRCIAHAAILNWLFDLVAASSALLMMFRLNLVSTPGLTKSLFDLMPTEPFAGFLFKALAAIGLIYGVVIVGIASLYDRFFYRLVSYVCRPVRVSE